MCNPALIVMAVSVGMTMYEGQQQQARAEKQADMMEATADANSIAQKNEATRVRNIGVEKENDHRRMVAELESKQLAQQGAAGIQTNTGSALQVREDTGKIGEIDALRIRNNHNAQADAMEYGSELTRIEGSNNAATVRAEGDAAAANSVLSSVGTVASSWYSPNSAASQTSAKPSTSQSSLRPNSAGNTYTNRRVA